MNVATSKLQGWVGRRVYVSPELQKFEGSVYYILFYVPCRRPTDRARFTKNPFGDVSYPVAASRDGATGIPLSGLCSQGAARSPIHTKNTIAVGGVHAAGR